MKGRRGLALDIFFVTATICVLAARPLIEATERDAECPFNTSEVMQELIDCYIEKRTIHILPKDEIDVDAIAKRFCLVRDPKSCLSFYFDDLDADLLQRCSTDKEWDELQMEFNKTAEGYKYACDNDGAKWKESVQHGGLDCFIALAHHTEKWNEVKECIKSTFQEIEAGGLDICTFIRKENDCVLSRLQCDSEKPGEFYRGVSQATSLRKTCWENDVARSSGNNDYTAGLCFYSTSVYVLVLMYSY